MLLTPQQLLEIRRIITDYHHAFIVNTISPFAVAPEILAKLRAKGLVDIRITSVQDAYVYGQLLAHLENPTVARMTYTQFRDFLRKNPIPMTPVEKQAMTMAEHSAGQYCVGLGNRVDATTGRTLIEADAKLRAELHDTIRTETAEAIARRESVQKLASNLGHATGDWARDWRRIANTEMQQAMQTGLAERYREEHGADVRVAKIPMPDACFRAGTLIQTQRGLVPIEAVQIGELVLTHKMRWRPVTHLFQRSFSGKLYGLNGCKPRVTGNHPFLVDLNWKRADSIERGQYVIDVVGAGKAQYDPTLGLEQCFFDHVSTAATSGGMPAAAVQLYRYLQARDSDIHVEWADGHFRDGYEALKFLAKSERFGSGRATGMLSGLGQAGTRFWTACQLAGFAGVSREVLALLQGHASQASTVAFGLAGQGNATFLESNFDAAPRDFEVPGQRFHGMFASAPQAEHFGYGDVFHGRTVVPHASIVKSIAIDTFTGDVFNLEVEEDQSYVADGFVVHNCEHCKRLFLGPDGKPRIWWLTELQAFGTNVGRKTRDWVPTVGTVHPHCQCQLIRVPKNFGFDAIGRLVPGGKFGTEGSAADFHKSLEVEDAWHKSVNSDDLIDFQGIPIHVEQRAGQERHWESATGERGTTHMLCAYGEVVGSSGTDGDGIDVFVGPDPKANTVYVVHQQNPVTGVYDEEKCMLGFSSEEFALQVYRAHYNKSGFDAAVSPMGIEQFKVWADATADSQPTKAIRLVIPVMEKAGGPFVGPRGGLWADAEHTIHWEPSQIKATNAKRFSTESENIYNGEDILKSWIAKAEDTPSSIPAIVGAQGSPAGHRNPGRGTAPNFLFNVPIRGPARTDPKVFEEMIEDEDREQQMLQARKRRRRDRRIYNVTKPVPDHRFVFNPPVDRAYERIRDGKHKQRQNALKQFELDNTGLLNEDHAFIRKAEPQAGPFIGPRGGKWADPEHTIPWKERKGRQAGPQLLLPLGRPVQRTPVPMPAQSASTQKGVQWHPTSERDLTMMIKATRKGRSGVVPVAVKVGDHDLMVDLNFTTGYHGLTGKAVVAKPTFGKDDTWKIQVDAARDDENESEQEYANRIRAAVENGLRWISDPDDAYTGPVAQGDSLEKAEQAIRSQPVEHGLFVVDGKVVHRFQGSRSECTLHPVILRKMQKQKNSVFTHNHPASGSDVTLSHEDIIVAAVCHCSVMRAVSKDGTVCALKAPKAGWGSKEDREWLISRLEKAAQRANDKAHNEMDDIIRGAGGTPGDTNSPGFSQERWHAIYSRRAFAEINGVLASFYGGGTQLERIPVEGRLDPGAGDRPGQGLAPEVRPERESAEELTHNFRGKSWDTQQAALVLPRFEFLARMAYRMSRQLAKEDKDSDANPYRITYSNGKWGVVGRATGAKIASGITAEKLYDVCKRTRMEHFFNDADRYIGDVHADVENRVALPEAEYPNTVTDTQVHEWVATAKANRKRQETKINRKYQTAVKAAHQRFGSSDVEQASRGMAIRRAEIEQTEALAKVQQKWEATLADLKNKAGEWAELVPDPPQKGKS